VTVITSVLWQSVIPCVQKVFVSVEKSLFLIKTQTLAGNASMEILVLTTTNVPLHSTTLSAKVGNARAV
jgi:hypothetical protein